MSIDEHYYKPTIANSVFNGNYMEYKSYGDN